MESDRAHVVIAGGGVAALEALIALSELASQHVRVTLVTPRTDFVSRPQVIGESFARGRRSHVALARFARDFGATHLAGSVVAVDAARRTVRCASGEELGYDSLLVATGGRRMPAYEHAEPIGDDTAADALHGVLADLEEGYLKRLAFVVPPQVAWTLPAYELALLVAHDAWSMGIDDAQLSLVTPEDRPLALFGPQAGAAVGELLAERGIAFVGGVCAEVGRGTLDLHPGGRRMTAERVFALPVVHGDAPAGLPTDEGGFIGTDVHGRVIGVANVFAAGDMTSFPAKHGGIAAQQAEAAAQAIAAAHGCAIEPEPFRPLLRGRLLTGGEDLFLERDIAGGSGDADRPTRQAWWPADKVSAPRLAPYLYALERSGAQDFSHLATS
ncbi:MAG: NAD(P)/FAD-dependent oxidoreductase [Solirubrobacteraceae bacterium]